MKPRSGHVLDWRPLTVIAVLWAVLFVAVGYDLVALIGPMLESPMTP